jgi:hypothetical protein
MTKLLSTFIFYFLFFILGCKSTVSVDSLPYRVDSSTSSIIKLCILDIKNHKLHYPKPEGMRSCKNVIDGPPPRHMSRATRDAIDFLMEEKKYDYVSFDGEMLAEFIPIKTNLPIKYKIYDADKSPYSDQVCHYSVIDGRAGFKHIKSIYNIKYCKDLASEFNTSPERSTKEYGGIYHALGSIVWFGGPQEFSVSDGLIEIYTPTKFNLDSYSDTNSTDVIEKFKNDDLETGKFKIQVEISDTDQIESFIELSKKELKENESTYIAKNAFNTEFLVFRSYFEEYSLILETPDLLPKKNNDNKHGLCVSTGSIHFIEKGRKLEEIKKRGPVTVYGTMSFFKITDFKQRYSSSFTSPTETYIKGGQAMIKVDAIEQNGKILNLYDC